MKRFIFILLLLGVIGMLSAQYLTESFEGTWTGSPAAPSGWTNVNGAPSSGNNYAWDQAVWGGSAWTSASGTYSTSSAPVGTSYGTAVAHYKDGSASSGQVDILRTPVVDLSGSTNPRIGFWYVFQQSNLNVKVLASNDGFATAGVQVAALTVTPAATWTRLAVAIPAAYKTTTAQFQIQITATYGSYDLWVDNVVIDETPAAMSGAYTIDNTLPTSGTNFASFTAAINAINDAGISAAVTFSVKDGQTFTEDPPVLTATGTSVNTITFVRDNSTGVRPLINATGNAATNAVIKINGGDYITFNGIDIGLATGTAVEYGYHITNASATNGAQYNTIINSRIVLDKTNTSTRGLYHYYTATPTSAAGANSYNTYQNLTIENTLTGMYLYGGSSTNLDLGNKVIDCTIGSSTAGNMGGAAASYGMYIYYQSGFQVYGNEIRNFTQTSGTTYGIYVTSCYGTTNLMYKNKIHDNGINYNTGSAYVYGMYLSLASSSSIKVYNNMIWNLTHSGYTSTTSSYLVYGIYNAGATASITYNIDFNTVTITGPAYGNSACYYVAAVTAVNKVRNNIFANLTPNQTGTPYHYCYYSSSATVIGTTNSISNNNILYLANEGNGFVGRGATTNFGLTSWKTTMNETGSRGTNPQFAGANDVHIQTGVGTPVESNGTYFTGVSLVDWVTTDIDGDAKHGTTPDIGADEGSFTTEGTGTAPTAAATDIAFTPASTTIDGTITASSPASDAYLVIRYTTVAPTAPVNGTSYIVGQTMGDANAIVVKTGNTLSFSNTGLTAGTAYSYKVYSYSVLGSDAPLYYGTPYTESVSTLGTPPGNPTLGTPSVLSHTAIDLAITANGTYPVLVAVNSTSTFGTPISNVDYSTPGTAIAGGGLSFYMGAAALQHFTGLTPGTTYYVKVWSYDASSGYNNFSTGATANATTLTIVNPTAPAVGSTATAAGSDQINLAWQKNANSNDVMVLVNSTATFGTPVTGTTYNVTDVVTGGGTVLYKGALTSYNHTSLTASTAYYYKLFSIEPSGLYYSSGLAANATTYAAPVTSLPFFEGFETGYTNATVIGTPYIQAAVSGSYYWTANNTATDYNRTPRTGAWNAYIHYSCDAWMFRNFTLTGGQGYTVTMYARQDMATSTDASVQIKYGTTPTDAGMVNNIVASFPIVNGAYQMVTGTFVPATTGTYFIGIRGIMNGTPYYISIDDITVDRVPDLPQIAITPTPLSYGLVAVNTTNNANITITNSGAGAMVVTGISGLSSPFSATWSGTIAPYGTQIVPVTFAPLASGTYSQTLTVDITGSFNGTNTVTVSGNAYPTNYLTQSFESATFPPVDWTATKVEPLYNNWISSSTAYDGTKATSIGYYSSYPDYFSSKARLTTLKLEIPNDNLYFYARNASLSTSILKVQYSADGTTWTDLTGGTVTLTNTYALQTVSLSTIAGGQYYLGFYAESGGYDAVNYYYGYVYLDKILYPPVVPIVPNAAVLVSPVNTTPVTVVPQNSTLNWASGGGAPTGYDVYFGTEADPPLVSTNQTATTYTPSPAMAYDTVYNWKVIPRNGDLYAATSTIWSFRTAPEPLIGTKTIDPAGSGVNNYTTFTAAVTALNTAGIAGSVIFNVKDGVSFVEEVPVLTATGTAGNTITFQRDNSGVANPIVKPTTGTQGIRITGGDYITFDGIDIAVASGQIPNWGYYITNGGATNGAQYNTIKNCKITLNKANYLTKGIYEYYSTAPTAATGANSYNTYQGITIENSQNGIYIAGHSTYNTLGTVITGSTIGGATAGDMGGTSTYYGIYLTYQSGVNVNNNEIRNAAVTSSYIYGYGIYMGTCYGENLIYKNKIHDLAFNYNTSSYGLYGIYLSMGSTGTNVAKVYNNMIWNLTHTLYTSSTSSYLVYGIYNAGATATNTYNIDFNTVAITGPAYGNSACYYAAAVTAVNNVRNNVFANLTPDQTGTPYHYCYYSSSATVIGAAGSVSNNNVLYVANSGNGFAGRGSSTNMNFATWVTTMGESASKSRNPQFISANDVHINTEVMTPVEANGSYGTITWVTDDIDVPTTTRNVSTPDIGADEGTFVVETDANAPTNQPTSLVLIPSATSVSGSFTAAAPGTYPAEGYLVVRYTTVTPTAPVDGTAYTVATTMGDASAVVVGVGSGLTFSTSSLTISTAYNFRVYSYSVTGIGAPKYNTVTPLDGSVTTFAAAPLNPATFTATANGTQAITLAATANAAGSSILVAYNSTSTFGTPLSTATYTVGGSISGGGTIWHIGTAATMPTAVTSLLPGTAYYYKAWSYNVETGDLENYSSGYAASATTALPAVPVAFTAVGSSSSQINLAATANAAGNQILVAYGTTSTFGTPVITTNYAYNDDIVGGGKVYYKGVAGSLTNHSGLTANSGYYYKVWSFEPVSGNYYYSTGLTANAATYMDASSTQNFGDDTASFPPAGWSVYSGLVADPITLTPTTGYWVSTNWLNTAATPVNRAARFNIYSTDRKHWLVTNPIELAAGNYTVNFDLALTDYANANPIETNGADDKFAVLIGDGVSWSVANVVRQWDNAGSAYVYGSIPTAGSTISIPVTFTSGVKYLAFYGESTVSNADNDLFVDNLSFSSGTVTDLAPTNLTATPLYKFNGSQTTFAFRVYNYGHATSATVSLQAGGVEFTTVPTGTIPLNGYVDLTVNWSDLPAGTHTITAVVPSDNNNANNTATLANVLVYPAGQLAEGFEGATFPPTKWLLSAATPAWEAALVAGQYYDGAKGAKVVITDIAQTTSTLYTPLLTLDPASTINFYAKSTGLQKIQMYYSPYNPLATPAELADPATSTWTAGSLITLTTAMEAYTYTPGLTGNYRVGFCAVPNGVTGTIYLDKVIGPQTYSPPEKPGLAGLRVPANEAINVDPITFKFEWDLPSSGGNPTNQTIFYSTNVLELTDQGSYNIENGTAIEWTPNSGVAPVVLDYNQRYYWTVAPANSEGFTDIGENYRYFTTRKQISAPTLSMGTIFPTATKTGTITITNGSPTASVTFTAAGTGFASFGDAVTIAAGGTYNLPYTFNGTATLGAYTGTITLTETAPQAGVTVDIPVTATISAEVTVGTGIAELYLPIDPYYGYGYSQSIYYPSELNWPAGYRIEKLYYYYNGYENCASTSDFVLYMGHTTNATFSSTTAWEPLANLTQVYSHPNLPVLQTGGYWMEFVLDTPFTYNGTSNLVIGVEENMADFDSNSSYFYNTVTTGVNRSIYYRNDTTNPNPATPPTGTLVAGYPNTKFVLGALPVVPVCNVTPASMNLGTISINSPQTQTFTISNSGGGTLTVTGISGGSAYFTLNNLPATFPFDLTTGSQTFDVNFNSATANTYNATVTISYGTASTLDIPCSATTVDFTGGYFVANSSQTTAPSYPTYNWVDISTTGTAISLLDDDFSALLPLGMTFPFYGTDYTDVYISSNGMLNFGTSSSSNANVAIPTAAAESTPDNFIAWFWKDLNPESADVLDYWIKYGNADGNFVATFYKMPNYSYGSTPEDEWITGQVILYPSGKIKLQYAGRGVAMAMDACTVGIENVDGTLGVQYLHNGTGGALLGTLDAPMAIAFGTDVNGLGDGATSLDAPTGVTIALNGTDIQISWNIVTGATSYKIYGSDNPYGATPWTPALFTVSAPALSHTFTPGVGTAYKFYYVTAFAGAAAPRISAPVISNSRNTLTPNIKINKKQVKK